MISVVRQVATLFTNEFIVQGTIGDKRLLMESALRMVDKLIIG